MTEITNFRGETKSDPGNGSAEASVNSLITRVGERVRKARGAEVPESFYSDPLMYQATSAGFLGPRDPVHVVSEEGLNAYGAVTWGQFFVYQGFNESAGWMHTSSSVDNIDEFLEEDEPEDDDADEDEDDDEKTDENRRDTEEQSAHGRVFVRPE